MMIGGKPVIAWLLCCVALSAFARGTASTPDNPYSNIIERNLFGLRPPPPLVNPKSLESAQVPKILLTGITTILGNKRALLKVQYAARPPEPQHEESYILAEGQRDGDVEVISVDENAGTVLVNNHGTQQNLDFVNNGVKLPNASSLPGATAPPPGAPGPPPAAAMNIPPPMPGNPGLRQIPTRPIRTGAAPGTSPGMGGMNGMNGMGGMGAGGPQAFPGQAQQQQLNPEQQMLLIEAQRAQMMDAGDPTHQIMPPTELTPALMPQ